MDMAMSACREAIRLNPDSAPAHLNMGNVFRLEGKLVEAISEYREAIRITPHYFEAHSNLGLSFAALASQTKHRRPPRGCATQPEDSVVLDNLAVALAEQGKQDEAIIAFRKAIRLKPDSPKPTGILARLSVARVISPMHSPS